MNKNILSLLFLRLLASATVFAQKVAPPKLTATPATESQKLLIRQGVAFHDRGDYDGAIAKYEEVLREKPDNDLALYELLFSYQMKKYYPQTDFRHRGA